MCFLMLTFGALGRNDPLCCRGGVATKRGFWSPWGGEKEGMEEDKDPRRLLTPRGRRIYPKGGIVGLTQTIFHTKHNTFESRVRFAQQSSYFRSDTELFPCKTQRI